MIAPSLIEDARNHSASTPGHRHEIRIPPLGLAGTPVLPADAYGLMVFVHGSGSSRLSPRKTKVATALNNRGIATLLFDLLTSAEEADRANVFDIPLLAKRLLETIRWLSQQPDLAHYQLGLFGASTGAAAPLLAAAVLPDRCSAVVSRAGRQALAGNAICKVRVPTRLIVGSADYSVIELNKQALDRLAGTKSLEIVPGAIHLFSEPGTLDAVIEFAAQWFGRHFKPDGHLLGTDRGS